jgi:hypothetical protein
MPEVRRVNIARKEYQDIIDRQAEQIKELRVALKKYGRHIGNKMYDPTADCNCGFEQALKGGE